MFGKKKQDEYPDKTYWDLKLLIRERPNIVLEKREIELILNGKAKQVLEEDIADDIKISRILAEKNRNLSI